MKSCFCFVLFLFFLKKEGSICVSACLPLPFQQPLQGDSQISFLPPENLIDPLRIHLSPLSLLPALLSCSHLFLLTHNPKHQQDIEVWIGGTAVPSSTGLRKLQSNKSPTAPVTSYLKKNKKNKKPFHTSQIQIDELQRERKSDHNQPVYELDSRSVRLAGLAVIVIESLTGWSCVCRPPRELLTLVMDRGTS